MFPSGTCFNHECFSEIVKFTSIIRHSNTSLGEASPVYYRILLDQFMGFVPAKNNVTTNYIGDRGTSLLIRDEEYRMGSFLELVVRYFPV